MKMKNLSTRKRVVFLGLFISILLFALTIRLAHIQIILGKTYSKKALEQRTLPIAIHKVRGDILDRNKIPLTRRQQGDFLLIFPRFFDNNNPLLDTICKMTEVNNERMVQILSQNKSFVEYEIINPNEEVERQIKQGEYPGLMILRKNKRYDDTSIARHLVGYLREYDHSPQSGIEKEYDKYLHSDDVVMVDAIIDAQNRLLPGTTYSLQKSPQPHYNVQLTIDYYIQKILEDVLDRHIERAGGVIVDVQTGEILALASRPNFDQNNVYQALKDKDSLWSVPMKAFPPGSLFKTVVAAVGIEQGLYTGETPYTCNGKISINGITYKCNPSIQSLGEINIRQAFAHSCNDLFINIAQQVGGQATIDMANKLGLGQSLDIGLDNDPGNLPTKSQYSGAGIGNLALGQDKVETSPLQIAQMMTIIANDGIKKELSLVKAIIDQSGKVLKNFNYIQYEHEQVISYNTAKELKTWMMDVTEYGTGKKAFSKRVGGSAGKTGTPQITGDDDAKYYGWFAGFFPLVDPKYVTVILVRQESEGGDKAAKIFKEIADEIIIHTENIVLP
ncbi:MAG: penicillin-binding protein 2 [Caldicoprobacterales bacterium]|nr:penicillin-binding protein 2 [Clostridiales bacterium]